MFTWILITSALSAPLGAQQRHVEAVVAGGQRISGRVLELDLEHVTIDLGDEVVRVEASQLRSCRFGSGAAGDGGAPTSGEDAGLATGDARGWWSSDLLSRRVGALERAYPWLAPAGPAQWLSLGVLLLVGASLLVHVSANVAGADRPRLGLSVGLGIYYSLTALGQAALVPVHDLSVSTMVLLNGSLSLLLLCRLFGLSRGQALVAQSVQLGFGGLIYAGLELVSALLGSIGLTP